MKKKSFDENESNSNNSNNAKSNNAKSNNNGGDNIRKFVIDVLVELKMDFLSANYSDKFSNSGKNNIKYVFENGTVVILTSDNYLVYIKDKKGKRAKLENSILVYVQEYFNTCIDSSIPRPKSNEYYSFNRKSAYDDYFKYKEKKTYEDYDPFYKYKNPYEDYMNDYFNDYINDNYNKEKKSYNNYGYTKKSSYEKNVKKYTPEQIKYQDLYKKLKSTYDQRIEQIKKLS